MGKGLRYCCRSDVEEREKIERETSEHEPEELKRMCSKKLTLHTANGEHNIEYCNQANAFIKPDHLASVSCGVW